VQNGQLVDAPVQADPVARQFAQHLTDNYLAYAAVDPTFAEVLAGAQMSALARTVWERATNGDPADDLPLDADWWLKSFKTRPVATPATTPALQAVSRTVSTQISPTEIEKHWIRAAGGVSFAFDNLQALPDPQAAADLEGSSGGLTRDVGDVSPPAAPSSSPLVPVTCSRTEEDLILKNESGDEVASINRRLLRTAPRADDPACAKLRAALEAHTHGGLVIVDSEDPNGIATWLRRACPGREVLATKEGRGVAERVQRLRAMTTHNRRVAVVVVGPSLDREQRQRLKSDDLRTGEYVWETYLGSLRDIPDGVDTVIVVGHRTDADGALLRNLAAGREEDRLGGKGLIVLACGGAELTRAIHGLFRRAPGDPACVSAPGAEVEADLIPFILEAVADLLGDQPQVAPDSILRLALRNLATLPVPSTWKRSAEDWQTAIQALLELNSTEVKRPRSDRGRERVPLALEDVMA